MKVTLCFLVRTTEQGSEVLLGMKKRGWGVGKWNGIGGKVGDESIEEAARREVAEEIAVRVGDLTPAGRLRFLLPEEKEERMRDIEAHIFLATDWQGEPHETDEMRPRWFSADALPYREMWDDDPLWLPQVLTGEFVAMQFTFDGNGRVIGQEAFAPNQAAW